MSLERTKTPPRIVVQEEETGPPGHRWSAYFEGYPDTKTKEWPSQFVAVGFLICMRGAQFGVPHVLLPEPSEGT